jgi:hypothetical protein
MTFTFNTTAFWDTEIFIESALKGLIIMHVG